MLNQNVHEIKEKDILQLIDDGISEGIFLEYKECLPDKGDENRKEMLADISSFANCDGGHLIFGIKEEKGVPISITGIEVEDEDALILQFENVIRDAIAPRIQANIRVLQVTNKKVLIVAIKRSWNKPHRVIFRGWDKFFSRNSAGKYPLDIEQLRAAFLQSNEGTEKLKAFLISRISEISANTSFIKLENCGKMAIFVLPLNCFSRKDSYNVIASKGEIRPPYSSGYNDRINIEGILNWAPGNKEAHSYVELYRNGIIEGVTSGLLNVWQSEEPFIPSSAYETTILDSIGNYIAAAKKLEIDLPVVIFIAFINIKNYTLAVDRSKFWHLEQYKYDKEMLILPEVLIEEHENNIEQLMRPIFDLVWNAFGFQKCYNYDEEGKYIRR
jgi:Predicted transcriptional regulator containing an HTH domain and an uncharacterized domain shared with the mammalian protein Schlafen